MYPITRLTKNINLLAFQRERTFGMPGNVYDREPESSAPSAPSPFLSIKILWRSLHSLGLRNMHWMHWEVQEIVAQWGLKKVEGTSKVRVKRKK